MKSLFTLSILCYLFFFLGLRLYLYPEIEATSRSNFVERPIGETISHSSRFNSQGLAFQGQVVQSGYWFYDLFFIKSYLLEDENGDRVRVVTRHTVPETGNFVLANGIFSQYYHGQLIQNWSGLYELQRTRLREEVFSETLE